MRKGIIILGLLVGTTMLLIANGRNGNENGGFGRNENSTEMNGNSSEERQRRNVVDPEECTLEGEEVGTGYLNNDARKFENQSKSGRGRNRRN